MATERKTTKIIKKWQTFLIEVASLPELQLIEHIGKGSFGRVFKAVLKNDPTQTLYAVKIIKTEPDNYIPELKTLTEYYSIIQKCCPDCLVTVFPHFFREGYDEEEDEKFLVIVSQYVLQTLEDLKGKLKLEEAVSLTLKLIECLKSFSKKGLIYTDLKPANLGTFESLIGCKIIDIGGFKRSKQLEDLAQTIRLSRKSYSDVLFTPLYAPPELPVLRTRGRVEIKKFIAQELKEGRTYSYMLGVILGELIGVLEEDPETASWRIKENELKLLLEKALQIDREKRPLLEEFEEELKRYLYGGYKPLEVKETKKEEPPRETTEETQTGSPAIVEIPQIHNYVVKSGQRLVLEGKTYRVNGDIKIEPGGELIIRNATVEFSENGGIIGKDCTFVAENSKFLPQNEKWKNITLVGNIKGHIEECLFRDGGGRLGKEINEVKNLNLKDDKTMGGALFIESSQDVFLIKDSSFENCRAEYGGGVYAYQSNQIE